MNTQNLVNLSLTETQIANVDAALTTLETELAGLIALSATDKRRMRKMGNKTESFSRQALQVVNRAVALVNAVWIEACPLKLPINIARKNETSFGHASEQILQNRESTMRLSLTV